jgi:hypothetical protein
LLWTIPFLIFLITINFASFFHLVLLLPAFRIAASRLMVELCDRLKYPHIKKILSIAIISIIGVFGLINTTILIDTNVTSSFFLIYSSIVKYLTSQTNIDNEFIMLVLMVTRFPQTMTKLLCSDVIGLEPSFGYQGIYLM